MRAFWGLFLIVLGLATMAFLGIWICLIGGIIGLANIIHQMSMHQPWSAGELAWDVIRIVLADSISVITGGLIMMAGFACFTVSGKRRKKAKFK